MITIMNRPDVAVVVLTRNAGLLWPAWLSGIEQQTVKAGRYLVIDSQSSDGTVEQAIRAGLDIYSIDPQDFNHGGTRQLAAQLCPDAEFIVYLTQDAILEQVDSLEQLLRQFEDPSVAMAYGRHIAHKDASLLEQHARAFTYPETSASRTRQDFGALGFRAAFSSDVYACYRVSALRSVGGFPDNVIVSEDSYVTACLLMAGWKTVYSAQSRVRHSHQYSLVQVFRRYFDVGVFHAREAALLNGIGKPDKEAGVYVRSLIAYLNERKKLLLPYAALQTLVKLLGFRLGKQHVRLPRAVCKFLSMQKAYWKPVPVPERQEGWLMVESGFGIKQSGSVGVMGRFTGGGAVSDVAAKADVVSTT